MSSGLDASSSAIHPQSSTLDLGASLSGSSALLAPGCSLLGRSSVIDAHLHAESAASYNSRSDRVLRLRRSYALSRDAHHAGLLEPGQSLSQLRHAGGYGRRHHPLSRSLPSLARDGGDVGDVGGRRKRPRAGLRPAPRTKAERDMLFHGARGSIFAKHVVRAGLPDKSASSKQGKRRLYPSGFSGERSAKTGAVASICVVFAKKGTSQLSCPAARNGIKTVVKVLEAAGKLTDDDDDGQLDKENLLNTGYASSAKIERTVRRSALSDR